MTPVGTSVLVVDQNDDRADATRRLLIEQGYAVSGVINAFSDLADLTVEHAADTIMIYANVVDDVLLDAMRAIPAELRRPVVLITEDSSTEVMHAAVGAGVNACVVVGVNGNRVRSAIDLAKANFSNTRGLREELDEARTALRERKIIERAKGIIMRERGLSEDEAYASLRNRAMQRGVRLIVVAEMINEAAEVMQL